MRITFRNALKAMGWSLLSVTAIAAAIAVWLIVPGTPTSAKSLDFRGFVLLPSGALLTVLDYLTVDDGTLYVTNESTGSAYKIALHPGTMPHDADIAMIPGEPATHGVLIDPLTHLAFVTRSEVNTVDVFDPAAMAVLERIPVGDDPDGIFYEPVQKLVYVANGDAHRATLIDPQTRAVAAVIPLGGKPEYAVFDAKTALMYQNLRDTNEVAAVDVAKKAVVERWPLDRCEEPSGMAMDELNRRLFVVCAHNGVLAVIDIDKKTVINRLSIGGGPDSVAFDAQLRRIYTTGKSGVLVAVQQDTPDAYHQIDRIRLHYGAHTLAVDPATHRVYVGYASLLVRPRLAVFSPLP